MRTIVATKHNNNNNRSMEKILTLFSHLFLTHKQTQRFLLHAKMNRQTNRAFFFFFSCYYCCCCCCFSVSSWAVCTCMSLPSSFEFSSRFTHISVHDGYESNFIMVLDQVPKRVGEITLSPFRPQSIRSFSLPLSHSITFVCCVYGVGLRVPKYVFAVADHFSMLSEYSLSNSVCVLRTHHLTRVCPRNR